eukprot:6480367-Amphidinium_carterae.1
MLQEEASAETPDGNTQKSDYLLKMLKHWKRHQWAGQPGIACCSTINDERSAMAEYWAPVFQTIPPVDEGAWLDFLDHAPLLAWPTIRLEDPLMRSVIHDSPASAPGPDGVTYAMVEASGEWGVRLLLTALAAILNGAEVPDAWSESHLIFLPKGLGCSLAPDQWRPLCLAN